MTPFSDLTTSRCEKLQGDHIYINLAVSLFILLGIFVSYLPQHYRIVSRHTSEGISPYFILLGTTSGSCGFANILTLPASQADVACCKSVTSFECFAGLLGIAQVGVQWSCFTVILLLFLVFFPRDSTPLDSSIESLDEERPQWRTALTVGLLCVLHGFAIIAITVILAVARPNLMGTWANILGLMAAGLAAVQYFPQIWTTYHLGHVGSLSIPMMVIQTPGSFVWAGSLAARLGAEGWSTWGVYLVTGCLQGCLLCMGITFELRARREREALGNVVGGIADGLVHSTSVEPVYEVNAVVEDGNETERTSLLHNSRKTSKP